MPVRSRATASRVPWLIFALGAQLAWALSRSPRWSFRLGRAYDRLGRSDAAVAAYQRAVDAPQAPPSWHITLARLLEARRDWEGAAAHYRVALADLPDRVALRLPLAAALEHAGDPDGASRELRTLLATSDGLSVGDLYDIGAQFERCSDLAGALDAYRRLDGSRTRPRTTKLSVRLARIHRRLGDLDEAEGLVAEGLATSPDHQGLLREHAELASARGDWDAAVARWASLIDRVDGPVPIPFLTKLVIAQRRSGRVSDAVATVESARRHHPTDLQLAAEDVRASIGMYGRVAEDEKHAWKERLVLLERLLSAHEAEVLSSPPQARALGNLRLVLRDWSRGVTTWRTLEERFPDLRTEACIKQARAHRSAGKEAFARAALPIDDPARVDLSRAEEHFVLARAALERAPLDPSNAEHVEAEQRRLAAQYGRWSSSHAATVAQLHLRTGEITAASRILEGALALRGLGAEQVASLRPIVARLGKLSTVGHLVVGSGTDRAGAGSAVGLGPRDNGSEQPVGPPDRRTVLVSGFLYSGSGAVYDYLRQFPSVAEPFGSHELWVLKKLNNFGLLLDPANHGSDQFSRLAVATVLTNIFGFGQMGHPISAYFEGSAAEAEALAEMVGTFIDDLARLVRVARTDDDTIARAGVERALQSFFAALIARFTPSGRTPVLNNVVPAFQLADYMRLFPHARAVVVLRDPRDQYVSQRLESPYSRDSGSFATMMETRYRGFADLLSGELRDSVLPVRFEDFVEREEVRTAVRKWVEIDEGGDGSDEITFDPARSRRNIGIHQAYAHHDEVTEVAERLLEPFRAVVAGAELRSPASV